jgi:5-methyltetrahydrofolate--homocysteine methyltransferase
MSRFLDALYSGRVLLMDGAMATELRRAGLVPGECPEEWNLTHPDRVRAVHEAYVDAGAECLVTNTFQSNPRALERFGLADRLEEINDAALALASSVCGPGFLLGSIGPVEEPVPLDTWARLLRSLQAADALLLETWSDCQGLASLAKAQRQGSQFGVLPLLFSATYRRSPTGEVETIEGYRPEAMARLAQGYPLVALGVNCGRDIGMDEVLDIVRRYRQETDLPLIARPNAGTPTEDDGRVVYLRSPESMAVRVPELLEAGVTLIGGCCGTTPEHIAAFRPIVQDWNRRHAPTDADGT